MYFTQDIMDITSIKLMSHSPGNANCRTICITDADGNEFSFSFYGQTDALDALPRSDHFRGPAKAIAETEAA